jgi:hypothetical protein
MAPRTHPSKRSGRLVERQLETHVPLPPGVLDRAISAGFVALALDRAPAIVNDALALSVRTGPSDGAVMPLRSSVAALAWKRLAPTTRAMFETQLAKTMLFAPQQFVEAIRRSDRAQMVHAQLEAEPELRAKFDRLLLILGRS